MENIDSLDLFIDLSASYGRIHKRVDRSLGFLHGLGVNDFIVMHQLAHAPDRTLSRIELADLVGLSASGVTRLLNPMDKNGLIKKQAHARDARVSLVQLTNTGLKLYNNAAQSLRDSLAATASKVSDSQKDTLLTIMRKLS